MHFVPELFVVSVLCHGIFYNPWQMDRSFDEEPSTVPAGQTSREHEVYPQGKIEWMTALASDNVRQIITYGIYKEEKDGSTVQP